MLLSALFQVVQKLWKLWEIQGLVLFSLSLQIILIFTANLRLRCSSWLLTTVLWSAYLLADNVATYALGYLSQTQQLNAASQSQQATLFAFWAPFLLLHLGGPDTITAFSLEDNELWRRHLLNLVLQVLTAFYVFAKSLHTTAHLLAPSILMFISGILKYGERTWALRAASMDCLRSSMVTQADPGPNYAKFMEEFESSKNAGLHARIDMVAEGRTEIITFDAEEVEIDDAKVVCSAYEFYETYRRLVVDLILSFSDRIGSQTFFRERSARQAFKVIEVELFFLYEALHSKATVIHTHLGRCLRLLTLLCTVAALVLFRLATRKNKYQSTVDTTITYVLLVGAVALEVCSVVLMVVSYWTYVKLRQAGWNKTSRAIFAALKRIRRRRRWWSNSVGQCNLIGLCLERRPRWLESTLHFFRLEETWTKLFRTGRAPVSNHLKWLVFKELKEKANCVSDARSYKRFSAYRGEWALQQKGFREELGWSIDDAEFDESILLWHIATTICMNYNDKSAGNDGGDYEDVCAGGRFGTCYSYDAEDGGEEGSMSRIKDTCKQVSNYMLYLLVAQPFMLPAGIGQIRFGDTCKEARNFFLVAGERSEEKACERLRDVQTDYQPVLVKGDRSKSVLFDGCRLAKKLLGMDKKEQMWRVISSVWVEMMCFAAIKCRGNFHARQLTAGGELLTMVWFLMAHVGIGEQYRIESGHARAKLIVEK